MPAYPEYPQGVENPSIDKEGQVRKIARANSESYILKDTDLVQKQLNRKNGEYGFLGFDDAGVWHIATTGQCTKTTYVPLNSKTLF
jgi:hypothetical protein